MLVTDYLSKDIQPLTGLETPMQVLELMEDFGVSHLPLVCEGQFIGNVERLNISVEWETIKAGQYGFEHFYLTINSTLFDAVNLCYAHNTNFLPVFDNEEKYLGHVTAEDVLAGLSKMPFISENGAILIVETDLRKFAMSEVAKIVESNNARLLGATVSAFNSEKVQILVKIDSENVTSVSETFERFGYTIIFRFFNDKKTDLLQERYQQLMRYLDI